MRFAPNKQEHYSEAPSLRMKMVIKKKRIPNKKKKYLKKTTKNCSLSSHMK